MIPSSELILNDDNTLYHLHIDKQMVATNVIIVGDPQRSDEIAKYFDKVIKRVQNREFVTNYGVLKNNPITVISSGIGCDNIDIVITEVDAAVNVDLNTRTVKKVRKQLNFIRLGTSGGLQQELKIGDYVISQYSIGIEGLAHFYKNSKSVRDLDFENEFITQCKWNNDLAKPYVVQNDPDLVEKFSSFAKKGATISAGGFFGPQGRVVRLNLAQQDYLKNIENFAYKGHKITNFEMEGAAIAALGHMLGHKCVTICAIIAQRAVKDVDADHTQIVHNLIQNSLQVICK